ncbi:MAG: S-isoprenylcysteine methyltransferase [Candidatus Omnitrophica bacterium]|nr:S-isoprenylcysteine methyltransferase [Candidatus Omnitrophota bacterium]
MTPVMAVEEPSAHSSACGPWLHRMNVAIGNFFFHYRNAFFPLVIVFVTLCTRPKVLWGDPATDRLLTGLGAVVALLGQGVRLATIGFEYIERGGKNKRVYASRLVHGGVYALTRNPMYLGNILIATGIIMVAGAPLAYGLVLPFFIFVYQAITSAEETYLRQHFERDYEEYCAQVNRFLPSLRNVRRAFSGSRYNWKRALRQDLSTIAGLLSGLVLLPLWRMVFLHGWDAAWVEAPRTIALETGVGLLYAAGYFLKKSGRLT